jgi:hypothetical protein
VARDLSLRLFATHSARRIATAIFALGAELSSSVVFPQASWKRTLLRVPGQSFAPV